MIGSSAGPAAALMAAALFLTGCASGPSGASVRQVNQFLAAGDYLSAEAYIEKVKETQYGKKNMVLFYLDKGTVLHHAGKYKESDAAFDRAESRMDELYTKSITQASGLLLLNDTTMDYAGEPFERAMTNVLRALNYVFLNKPDEALVESRKVEAFLDELNRRLEKKNTYKDDAFARYLDSMLYQDAGKYDDARISLEHAKAAYAWYASLYRTPMPEFSLPPAGKDRGELVFIHYNGVSPRKIAKTWQIAWNDAVAYAQASDDVEVKDGRFKNALSAGVTGKAITVSYPAYVQDPFRIVSSEVEVDGKIVSPTLLMEDISAIAHRSLEDRMALIKVRAIARATIKFVLAEQASKAAAAACEKKYSGNALAVSACKGLSRGMAHGVAAATETADTRGWAALPAQIRMARVRLPAGKHQVTIRYKDASGAIVTTQTFKDVMISAARRTYLHHRTAI